MPAHHVSSLKASGDEMQLVTTQNANDPILLVSLDAPLLLKRDKACERLEWAGHWLSQSSSSPFRLAHE
jgi:hypothetical protein